MPADNFKYIYALKDPSDGQIKYIGQTGNIKRRLFAHMAGQSGSSDKKRWILGLKMLGLQPEVILLESVSGCALDREKYWINHYQDQGLAVMNGEQGRPQLYSEKLISRNHWMTPHGHQYIRAHKREIEDLAQKWDPDDKE